MLTHLNGQNLGKHRWKDRLLIIQAADAESELYKNQLKEFHDVNTELMNRKLVLYEVIKDQYRLTDYTDVQLKRSWQPSSKLSGINLIPEVPFRVILIGLDGGIKLEKTTLLKRSQLFNIIDAMPMRINELRNNGDHKKKIDSINMSAIKNPRLN